MSDSLPFNGKIVLVTGASNGIGRATALAFGRRGAKLVLGDLDDKAAETASLIVAAAGTATLVKTDVSQAASVEALVTAAVKAHGRVDIAFNNAGLLPRTADLAEMKPEDFDRTIAVICGACSYASSTRSGRCLRTAVAQSSTPPQSPAWSPIRACRPMWRRNTA